MRIQTLFFTLFSLLLLNLVSAVDKEWTESYDEAVKLSKKSGKPILMNFTGSDW